MEQADINTFWSRVDASGDCWLWLGPRDKDGYGLFSGSRRNGRQRHYRCHRFAWHATHGVSAGKLLVCHHCDNPTCVRPDHLFLGTARDNFHDCLDKGRYSPKGAGNASAKLTEQEVARVRELWASGDWTQQAIANDFGLDQTTVSSIVRRKTWSHVA